MKNSEITDPHFREAVEAIDTGNIEKLKDLLQKYPSLALKRLDLPQEGYFKNSYLLWFIADNPVRNGKLPSNIIEVTRILIDAVKAKGIDNLVDELDYTLALVATGNTPKKSGVQIQLIDLLIDAGAKPGGALGAVMHGNFEAARRLIERGGNLTLAAAICLDLKDDISRLLKRASDTELQTALAAAAFCGKAAEVSRLIRQGADVNAFNPGGFHSHSTPLHQAINSGSMEAVKVLVEAGADLRIRDKMYFGPALGWALHAHRYAESEEQKKKYGDIAEYIRESLAASIANNLVAAGILQENNKAEAIHIVAKQIDM